MSNSGKIDVPMYLRDVVFFDSETTGLDEKKHELLSIAAVRRSYDRKVIARYEALIVPRRIELAEGEALKVNGYTAEAWKDAIPLRSALLGLTELLVTGSAQSNGAPPIVVGHNVQFDLRFLRAAYEEAGLVMPRTDYHAIDTSSLAWPLCARGLFPKVKLEVVCTHLGISNEGQHGAMRDVERAIEVYDHFVPELGPLRTP